MQTIAIMNLKGGTGKTMTAINAAAILARDYGARVLLADADSQANLTEFVIEDKTDDTSKGGLADVLRRKSVEIRKTNMEKVKLLPADASLMALDITRAGTDDIDTMALADLLSDSVAGSLFDVCIIDCPPAFSAAAMAALIAADEVVVPLRLDAFGIRGMTNLLEQIRNMQRVNADLTLAGVLPTMYFATEQQKKAEADLRSGMNALGVRTFAHIRSSRKVDDSTFQEKPLIYSSPNAGATRDYKRFVADLMGGGDYVV